MAITGKATAVGTAVFQQNHPNLNYVPLSDTGLLVSQAGFGGYRINLDNGWQEQALRFALQNGINLIDTSSNYGDGGSERLIGRVLAELIDNGELQREQVVIVSKVGYIQGFNFALARQRKAEGRPFPNVVPYADGLEHCIHPEFIEDQLTRSLERLSVDTIDGYLLHNPEYYLMREAKMFGVDRAAVRGEYERRMRMAFAYLEEEVANGRIQYYGISSNTFPEPSSELTHTDLQRMWEIAAEVAPDHHFRIVQMPMNLFETGAATEPNQPERQTTLQSAHSKNLAVLINRPLNALWQNSVTRLADVAMPNYPATPEDVSTTVDSLVTMEIHFQLELLPKIMMDEESRPVVKECLAIGTMLNGRWGGFGSYQHWQELRSRFILPRARTAIDYLSELENLPPELPTWLDAYIEQVNECLAAVTAFYQEKSSKEAAHIKETAVAADADWQAETLSQTAVRALLSTKGVTSVLVGMRQQAYVEDVLRGLAQPVEVKERKESWLAYRRVDV